MYKGVFLFTFLMSYTSLASEVVDGFLFVSKSEYYKDKGPCACPSDKAKRGKCGRRAALCRNGGANILDCGKKKITSISNYKKVKKDLCGIDF